MSSALGVNTELELRSFVIGYGKSELMPPLNASSRKGELVALIGRNGIGKSTLLRTIAGLQPPLAGDALLEGLSLEGKNAAQLAKRMGYLSTEMINAQQMTVFEIVALGRYPHTGWLGNLDTHDREVISRALSLAGLSGYENRMAGEISDGERQKAMIARILAQDTPVMIMDEPTAFLDIASRYEILHLLHSLTKNEAKTIIFSTHDLHMAISQSDRMWLLDGNGIAEGAPEDLVLSGALGHLFETEHVRFETASGNFVFRSDRSRPVNVRGPGYYRKWTEKALSRAGYSISEKESDPWVEAGTANKPVWKICRPGSQLECGSVYELITSLKDCLQDISDRTSDSSL